MGLFCTSRWFQSNFNLSIAEFGQLAYRYIHISDFRYIQRKQESIALPFKYRPPYFRGNPALNPKTSLKKAGKSPTRAH